MNKPKHTPGRWYYDEETQTVRAPAVIGDGHWFTVATCDRRNDNNDADARLIAQSPNLLKIAQEMLAILEQICFAELDDKFDNPKYNDCNWQEWEDTIKEATK